jgi:hypothetical protein
MVEKYTTQDGKEIVCQDLTYGYLVQVQEGVIAETKHGVVMNGANLSEDEVFDLRNSDVNAIYDIITRLTYPDLFDEDGNLISQDAEEPEDKKKA